MNPRRLSSKKWTRFPKEFSEQIESVFRETFGTKLAEGKLIVEGRIYPEELLLRVGYLEKGRLKQANFEVSTDYENDENQVMDRIHNLVDVAASMMMEYIESEGEVEFPYTWKEFPFKGRSIYLQYNTENSDLEAQANALLGIEEGTILHEEEVTEDALERAEKDHLH